MSEAKKEADAELNAYYQRLLKQLGPAETTEDLRQAERLWLQYRNATCAAEYNLYGGGTGGPPTQLACLGALTRERLHVLHTTYDWLLEK